MLENSSLLSLVRSKIGKRHYVGVRPEVNVNGGLTATFFMFFATQQVSMRVKIQESGLRMIEDPKEPFKTAPVMMTGEALGRTGDPTGQMNGLGAFLNYADHLGGEVTKTTEDDIQRTEEGMIGEIGEMIVSTGEMTGEVTTEPTEREMIELIGEGMIEPTEGMIERTGTRR